MIVTVTTYRKKSITKPLSDSGFVCWTPIPTDGIMNHYTSHCKTSF